MPLTLFPCEHCFPEKKLDHFIGCNCFGKRLLNGLRDRKMRNGSCGAVLLQSRVVLKLQCWWKCLLPELSHTETSCCSLSFFLSLGYLLSIRRIKELLWGDVCCARRQNPKSTGLSAVDYFHLYVLKTMDWNIEHESIEPRVGTTSIHDCFHCRRMQVVLTKHIEWYGCWQLIKLVK